MIGSILFAEGNQGVEFLGVKLVGVSLENGKKLLLTLAFILIFLLLGRLLTFLARWLMRSRRNVRVEFWTHQVIRLVISFVLVLGVVSIWFDDPTSLATAVGLVTVGLSFALQKVITAVACYFVILRGKTYSVGDRISIAGVRGDVLAIDFIKTTIMEMGQASTNSDAASTWVRSRQYTGRIVTVTNDKIFNEPVYNYSRDFPYIWEEMSVPITYKADRQRAEQILLEAVGRHTVQVREISEESRQELERRYSVLLGEMEPKVYYRLTDNWLELTVRFVVEERGVRDLKDAMSRDILKAFDEAGIGIASATFEIVGLPPVRVQQKPD